MNQNSYLKVSSSDLKTIKISDYFNILSCPECEKKKSLKF